MPVRGEPAEKVSAINSSEAVIAILLVGLGAVGVAWWALTSLGHPAAVAVATIPVAVLDDPAPKPFRVAKVASPAKTNQDLLTAQGRPTTFFDVTRATYNKTYMGKLIRFDSVPVNSVASSGIFTVGPSDEDSVLVKLAPGASAPKLGMGESICLVGRVMPRPTRQTERRWGITALDEAHVGHRTFYIQAVTVRDAASNR